jgi:hypothetical protein
MSGEIFTAKTIEEAKEKLQQIYKSRAITFKMISKAEYEAIDKSEREDSDNHLNLEKLGKESAVIDLAFYKYTTPQTIAYKIEYIHEDGISRDEDYFVIKQKQD